MTVPDVELWFPVGEELIYRAYWGVLYVGDASITSSWVQEEDGRTVILLRVRAQSNRVLRTIFPVDNLMETRVDPETFLPISYLRRWRHGRREAHEVTTFDYAAGKAHFKDLLEDKEKEYEIAPDTRDLISFIYYMRSQQLEAGTTTEYRVMSDDKIYDLELEATTTERIRTSNHGYVDTLRVVPKAEFEGIVQDRGYSELWVSQDPRRLSVLIEVVVPVASVRLRLMEVRGPGEDAWTGHYDLDDDPSAVIRR